MTHVRWLGIAAPLLVFFACRAGDPAGSGSLTAAEAAGGGPPAAHAERMPRCPSVVAGATTLVSEVPGGVELRVTASGVAAKKEIRRRAGLLAAAADATRGKHQASGAGRAQFARCPVVMRNTSLDVRDVPGGVAIVVRPPRASELAWLRAEAEARAAQLAAPKPFGQGMMSSCPNAVPNSETTVTDAPYGVDVRVTESTPEGTRAIRERAKDLASHDAPARDARCPVTTPDATLTVAEVPGGVVIAVKAKRADDVGHTRRDVRSRARRFMPPSTRDP